MSLIFFDSFDHYSTSEISLKWNAVGGSPAINTVTYRTGGRSLYLSTGSVSVSKAIPNLTTAVFGFAYNTTSGGREVMRLVDVATAQNRLYLNVDGTLAIERRTATSWVTLGTSVNSLSFGTWNYIEGKILTSNSGTYEIRLNGTTILSGSGDTQNTANAYVTIAQFLGGPSYFDDLYILDTSGILNTDFLGDIKVEVLYPNSDGAYLDWTPVPSVSGIHYINVDEVPPDSDTTYVITSGLGNTDTYGFTDLTTTSGTIFGIQLNPFIRKDDAGSRFMRPAYYIGSNLYSGSSFGISTSYVYYPIIAETSPATLSNWTISEINNAEFGVMLDT